MVLVGLGSVAYQRGDYTTAQSYYQQALAVQADLADAHWGLALAAAARQDDAVALAHFERFLQLAPQSNQAEQARASMREIERRQAQP